MFFYILAYASDAIHPVYGVNFVEKFIFVNSEIKLSGFTFAENKNRYSNYYVTSLHHHIKKRLKKI